MHTRTGLLGLVGLMVLVTLILAACGGATATPSPEMAKAEPEVMADAESSMGDTKDAESQLEDKDSEVAMDKDSSNSTSSEKSSGDTMDSEEKGDFMKEESDGEMETGDSEEVTQDTSQGELVADDSDAMVKEPPATEAEAELLFDVSGLENLGEGWAYEGWLIVDGAPVSTGVFTIDENGIASASAFVVDAVSAESATAIVLTIEQAPDPDPAPSAVHVLGGDLVDGSARLTAGHAAALGNDYAAVAASYILGIPSSDSAADSYTSGIWFNKLDLPALPEGWIYEGWVVGADGAISTGRFATDKQADSDGNGPTAGPNPGPSFPGQDFLNPALDLTNGYAAVISIEPVPDNSLAPFTFKPLVDMNIEDVGDHGSQAMENVASAFPSGSAMLKAMDPAAGTEVEAIKEETAEEEAAKDLPAWFTADLTDVTSGETFTIAGFQDKVLLVETMAIWCSNCLRQQQEVKALHGTLGAEVGLVTVVLDIDPNEKAEDLRDHAAKHGFDWTYAVAPREVAREIGQLYGDQFLNPPSTPMLIIDRHGEVHLLPFGRKTAEDLQLALEPFLVADM